MTPLRFTLVLLAALALAPASAFGSAKDVIKDCQDGSISGKYSQKDFNDALNSIPTDVDEYTDCRDVIRRAQLGSAGGSSGSSAAPGVPGAPGGGAGTSGGAPVVPEGGGTVGGAEALLATASPAEQKAVREAMASGGTAPVTIAGQKVSADGQGLSPAGAANVLPTPLIVALVLLGLALLLPLARAGRTHLPTAIRGVRARVSARRDATA